MKKVLLISGTGAIGEAIVDELLKKNDIYIVITSRHNHKSRNSKVIYEQGNIRDNYFRAKLKEKGYYDAIIDLSFYGVEEFNHILPYLVKMTGQYIFISSARIYDDTHILTENSRLLCETKHDLKVDSYAFTKIKEENILKRYDNWTIVRPYITYNINRLQLGMYEKDEWLSRIINNKPILFPAILLERKTALTYAGDVAKRIVCLLGDTRCIQQVFQIASNETKTWREIIDIYIDEIRKIKPVNPKIIITNFDDYICKYFDENKYYGDRLFDRVFDCSKIDSLVNNKYTLLEEGIHRCLRGTIESNKLVIGKPEWDNCIYETEKWGYGDIYISNKKYGQEMKKREIICFGAGKRFIELYDILTSRFCIKHLIDNSVEKIGKSINGIVIESTKIVERNLDSLYIITACDGKNVVDMMNQLYDLGALKIEHIDNMV